MSETAATREELFRSSVVVTGTHYSMTTLTGRLLAAAPEFHLLHEPTNPEPTLSHDSLAPQRWFEFHAGERYGELRAALMRFQFAEGLGTEVRGRLAQIRSPRDALRVVRYLQRKLPLAREPRRVVFKDPFLAFSARELQQRDGLRVVLTVRHPAAFAESFIRAGNGFDFADLLQDDLVAMLPELEDEIALFARAPRPLAEQAALVWQAVYGFAARELISDARTFVLRQDRLVEDTSSSIDALFAFAGATRTPAVDRFATGNLGAEASDHSQGGSYIRRDGQAVLGKWRQRLSRDEVGVIRTATGELAARYGYAEADW